MGPLRGNVPAWAIPADQQDNWPVSLPDQPDREMAGKYIDVEVSV